MERQQIRKGLLIFSYILFPITFNFFSPYLAVMGANQGIISGSLILFGTLFISAVFLGRAYCGWICPAGGLQEILVAINKRPFSSRFRKTSKWILWFPWFTAVTLLLSNFREPLHLHFLYMTESGVSLDEPGKFIIYFVVTALIVTPGLIGGKRGFCHSICWMAPFMITGQWIRDRLHLPGLRIRAEQKLCKDCKSCTKLCSMSIPVSEWVKIGGVFHKDCILCGNCVDGCRANVLKFKF